jgi:hypothetical protein
MSNPYPSQPLANFFQMCYNKYRRLEKYLRNKKKKQLDRKSLYFKLISLGCSFVIKFYKQNMVNSSSAEKQKLERCAALFLSILFVFALGLFLLAPVSRAAGVSPFTPFGGWIVSTVANPTPAGALICPVYSVVTNVSPTNGLPPTFGIYIPAFLPGPIYAYGNMFTPGVPLVGGLLPIPCPAPIPVYPLYYNLPFYMLGTGSL